MSENGLIEQRFEAELAELRAERDALLARPYNEVIKAERDVLLELLRDVAKDHGLSEFSWAPQQAKWRAVHSVLEEIAAREAESEGRRKVVRGEWVDRG